MKLVKNFDLNFKKINFWCWIFQFFTILGPKITVCTLFGFLAKSIKSKVKCFSLTSTLACVVMLLNSLRLTWFKGIRARTKTLACRAHLRELQFEFDSDTVLLSTVIQNTKNCSWIQISSSNFEVFERFLLENRSFLGSEFGAQK